MPHQTSTESNPAGVVIAFTGVVSGDEIIALNDRLASEESYSRCHYQVWDFSKATRLDITIDELRGVSERDVAASAINPNVKIAIVGEEKLFRGRDRIFQTLEEVWTIYRPKIFVDVEAAKKWAASDHP